MSDSPKTRVGFRTRRQSDQADPPTLGYHPQQLKALVGESRIRRAGAGVAVTGKPSIDPSEDYLEVVLAALAAPPPYPGQHGTVLREPQTTIAFQAGTSHVPSQDSGLRVPETALQRSKPRQPEDYVDISELGTGPRFQRQEPAAIHHVAHLRAGVTFTEGSEIPTRLAPDPNRRAPEPTEILRTRQPLDMRIAVVGGIGLVALAIIGVRAALQPNAGAPTATRDHAPALARPPQAVAQSLAVRSDEYATALATSPPVQPQSPKQEATPGDTENSVPATAPKVRQARPKDERLPARNEDAGLAAASAASMLFTGDLVGAQAAYAGLARESSTEEVYDLIARILRRRAER